MSTSTKSTNSSMSIAELTTIDLFRRRKEHIKNLGEFCSRVGFGVPCEEFGQRRIGVPWEAKLKPPGKGCEVFVAKLPRNYDEHDILPIFMTYGQVYEMRLMLDFSLSNRGICFVKYFRPEDADKAVAALDGKEIYDKHAGKMYKIGVVKSRENHRLRVNVYPKDSKKFEVIRELSNRGIDLSTSTVTFNKAYKCYVVDFVTHREAALARRLLAASLLRNKSHIVSHVEWMDPKKDKLKRKRSNAKFVGLKNGIIPQTQAKMAFADHVSDFEQNQQIFSGFRSNLAQISPDSDRISSESVNKLLEKVLNNLYQLELNSPQTRTN